MVDEANKIEDKELAAIVTFLKETKNGKYAPIEKISLPYARIEEETLIVESCEEDYYYSVS
jgi:hypothetical protein